MPQRRQAQQMHVPMSTQKHSKKRLFSSAQGWGEGGWARPIALSEGSSELKRPLTLPSPARGEGEITKGIPAE